MNVRRFLKIRLLAAVFSVVPIILNAQSIHEIVILENGYDRPMITIQTGDLVRWINFQNFGNDHDLISEDELWTSPPLAEAWTHAYRFNEPGMFNFHCSVHKNEGESGVVNVIGDPPDTGVDFNAGHNGNWWNGIARDGEGVQLELADAGGGELVFVATIYSYGPEGGQIFLVAVGTPDGDTVNVNVFITDGGVWGDGFDPNDVSQTQWGTGVFTSTDCGLISMELTPNANYAALGYTVLAYGLIRLTTPLIQCPYESVD